MIVRTITPAMGITGKSIVATGLCRIYLGYEKHFSNSKMPEYDNHKQLLETLNL